MTPSLACSRGFFALAAVVACLIPVAATASDARTPVSIELVHAVDTSLSVNDIEFDLQMHGIAQAFRSDQVIKLIGLHDGVAVTLIQWAGWVSEEHTVPWRLLTTPASIRAFAEEVERTGRDSVGRLTAIGTAIDAGLEAIAANRYAGRRLKIDVSGDGRSNAGPSLSMARRKAEARGVTINGLAVLTDDGALDAYFWRHVITGGSAFVIDAADYEDFARAIRIKLMRELAPEVSQRDRPGSHDHASYR